MNNKVGRKEKVSNEQWLVAIDICSDNDGYTTADDLMGFCKDIYGIEITSKSHLFKRLRELESDGHIVIERHARRIGYKIQLAKE